MGIDRLAIDTNVYSELSRGTLKESAVEYIISASSLAFSIVTIAELYAGFYNGRLTESNMKNLNSFIAKEDVQILYATLKTADQYGVIYSRLKSQGTPIPTNDIWIAAHCVENDYVLLTKDKHFKDVKALNMEFIS